MMHVKYFFWYGRTIPWCLYEWLFCFWWLVWSMFTSSNTSSTEMYREELSLKLGEVPFYGKTRCCSRSHHFEQGYWGWQSKVDLIYNLPPPKTVREVRSFLGHVGFYRRFIKDFSKVFRPLCNLLAKDVPFIFNDSCLVEFEKLKQLLASSPIIQPPNWSLPFELMCDASDYTVGQY